MIHFPSLAKLIATIFPKKGVQMEQLSRLLGFEARYLVYPLAAVLAAGVMQFVIRHYLKIWAEKSENGFHSRIVGYLESAILPVLLLTVLYFFSRWFPLSANAIDRVQKGVLAVILLLIVFFAARIAGLILQDLTTRREAWGKFTKPLSTLSNVMFVLIGVAVLLRVLNVDLSSEGVRLVRIVGIIVGAYVVIRIINLAVLQMERMVEDDDPAAMSEAEKRARTIGKIINSAGLVLVIGVAAMMVLSEFGMDITPIITGAGIAGLAVGFGAQNLVRDVISGFFLILEDQIRVGDVATVNTTGGFVEAIRLRTIVLRDMSGTVHIIPNGEIKQVSNMTKDFSFYVMNVGIAYKENVDHVMDVLRAIGEGLAEDPAFAPLILGPLEILGVDDFGDSQVTIKVRIKTLPIKQWTVGRELRRRIKNVFDERGIEIPFPHMSIYFGENSKPFDLALQRRMAASAGGEKETVGK